MRRPRAATLAAALVAVAALLPTTAWYVTGTRNLERETAALERDAVGALALQVAAAADGLAARLDAIRSTESDRPFYHYQSLYHDPGGAAQGLAVTPSPLAGGPSDSLVLSHFQIDPQGRVSLPAVNERFPELSAREGLSAYCDFLTAMHDAVVLEPDSPSRRDDERVLILDRLAWEQNLLAESVYALLTGQPDQTADLPGERSAGRVVIRVGPMRWRTLMVGSGPLLAAVREVGTPAGTVVQGFAIAPHEALAASVENPNGWRLGPIGPVDPRRPTAQVADTGWWLSADPGPVLAAAAAAAADLRAGFRRRFTAGLLAVLITAGAVVALVAGSERLAHQRAAFAAAAAHELKTPIASLRLHGEMLADGLGDPAAASSHARRIADESARLGRLVANMLDLARLERGATLVRPVTGDLAAAVADAVERARPALAAAGMQIVLTIAPDLPPARFDRDAVCQILDNLLDNAERHTRGAPRGTVEVTVGARGDRLEVTVADDGQGIPRAARHRLFRAFSRTSDRPSGLGIGLSIGRSLARAQDGDLRLEDRGAGAAFSLTIPVA